ncbi:MAG: hypothetical protein AAF907_03970, partial [Planctomycetota bacterium]
MSKPVSASSSVPTAAETAADGTAASEADVVQADSPVAGLKVRLALFLVAGAVGVCVSLLGVNSVRWEVAARTPIYSAPRNATAEERERESRDVKRFHFRMDAASTAFAFSALGGAFGLAAGFSLRPFPVAVRPVWLRSLRGTAVGVPLGAGAGVLGSVLFRWLIQSGAADGWGDAVGDRELIPSMIGFVVELGLLGFAIGAAVHAAVGRGRHQSFAGALLGPMFAAGSAGAVWGLLAPIAAIVLSSFTPLPLDATGLYRAMPDYGPEQLILLG